MNFPFLTFFFFNFFLSSQIFAASLVYVPEKLNRKVARVVVVIHGCFQNPESMALGSGWNRVADQNSLVIVYPRVPIGSNPMDCWNWYLPENQSSKSGQLKQLHDEIHDWKKRLDIKNAPAYVVGLSSGAIAAAGLLSCFPKAFVAGALHSGTSYGLASNLNDAELLLKTGEKDLGSVKRECDPKTFRKPIIVIHGLADTKVNPKNVNLIVQDFLGIAKAKAAVPEAAGGMKFEKQDYEVGEKLRGRIITIETLGHSWPGYADGFDHSDLIGPKGKFPTSVPFFESEGPSSTKLIFDFFEQIESRR